MRTAVLRYLACPACKGRLDLAEGAPGPDGHVMTGMLRCSGCEAGWPIEQGIPRLVHRALESSRETAARFATEWHIFRQIDEHHRQQFLDWIAPFGPPDLRGRTVLEAGCGKGRHSRLLGEWAAEVVSVDLGDAVEVAFHNTRGAPNVHVVQMDLLRPGLASAFDVAIAVGVLHHLADPEGGFRTLVRALRPGGRVITWTYGRENNGWIVYFVDPVRRALTSRLPSRLLLALSSPVALILWMVAKAVRRSKARVPYQAYLSYIASFPFREVQHIVFDQLTPPIALYLPRAEIERWYRDAGMCNLTMAWHNQNSWRSSAVTPTSG